MDRKQKIESMLALNNSNRYAINDFIIIADGFEISNNMYVCFYFDIEAYGEKYRLYSLTISIDDIYSIGNFKV